MIYLDEICEILETYSGRDKVIRTLCYSTKMLSGLSRDPLTANRFNTFSKQMSATRAVLRMLDDLPMLQTLLTYGLGSKEPDVYLAGFGVIRNVIDQMYYPIEKMSWLAEHNLIDVKNPDAWDTASSVCWVASIYLGLMKSIRYIRVLQKHKTCLKSNPNSSAELLKLHVLQQMEMLACIRSCFDFVHAVNTLPSGYLWSNRLNSWQVGLIGTISSFLGIYQLLWKRSVAKCKSN